ncbi:MAG: EpsG family protein [Clostridia bacterium]|nr:EpsG family protein [Clostridia bacterium]
MTPYVFMIIVWLIAFYFLQYRTDHLSEKGKLLRRKAFIWICATALFVIMGFRHPEVGIDTPRYLMRYYSSAYYDWTAFLQWDIWLEKELGFTLVGKILYSLGIPGEIYLMLYGLFITICISRLINKWCKNPFWGFYLHTTIGLFTMSMSGIRQSIACCICWFATDYILKKKPIRFALLVLLAATFHQSAIFYLAFYFVRKIKITKSSGWIIWLICLSFVFLRPVFVVLLNHLMPQKYNIYGMISDKNPINPLLVVISLLIPMFCLFFWERKKIFTEEETEEYSLCFFGSFLYALITIMSLSSNMIGRMSQYFYIFNVALLGNIITDIKDYKTRYIAILFTILLPGYMFFKSQSLGISPYYFFWQIYGE